MREGFRANEKASAAILNASFFLSVASFARNDMKKGQHIIKMN
jgi:hypothetical protein